MTVDGTVSDVSNIGVYQVDNLLSGVYAFRVFEQQAVEAKFQRGQWNISTFVGNLVLVIIYAKN